MLIRVRNFGAAHARRFAETSSAHAAFAIVATEVAQIEALAVAEHVSSRAARVARKGEVRQQFETALALAVNTAWVLSRTIPELADHADAPRAMGDRQLLTFGRGFVAAATPYAAQFAAHDIVIGSLGKYIEAFEAMVAESATRREELAQTRSRLKASVTRALEAVDTLDVTVANTFASDAVTLAAWKRDRRLEKPRPRPRAVKPAKPAVTSAPAAPAAPLEAVAPAASEETVVTDAPAVTDATATKAA